MNALAAEIALVLGELEAELILTQQLQGVPHVETDASGRLSEEASIPASLVNATRFFATSKDDRVYETWSR